MSGKTGATVKLKELKVASNFLILLNASDQTTDWASGSCNNPRAKGYSSTSCYPFSNSSITLFPTTYLPFLSIPSELKTHMGYYLSFANETLTV